MPKINDKQEAFISKIQALYDIEGELIKALPKMAKAANDAELAEGFASHLEETKEHSARLERIFEMLDEKPKKLKCEGIRGIVEDGKWIIDEVEADPEICDSMLAGGARHAEHYEMSGYMGAISLAQSLGLDSEIIDMLETTLAEEEAADEKLAMAVEKALAM